MKEKRRPEVPVVTELQDGAFLFSEDKEKQMKQEARSRDRPARENYAKLMRHEDVGSAREPPEKPVCTEKPECAGCPYPAHGFVCWCEKCMREKLKQIHREGGMR